MPRPPSADYEEGGDQLQREQVADWLTNYDDFGFGAAAEAAGGPTEYSLIEAVWHAVRWAATLVLRRRRCCCLCPSFRQRGRQRRRVLSCRSFGRPTDRAGLRKAMLPFESLLNYLSHRGFDCKLAITPTYDLSCKKLKP